MNANNNHIEDSLLMLFITGEADDIQKEEVETWLELSDDNQAYLDQVQEVWLKTAELNPIPVVVNIDAAWNKVSGIIDNLEDEKNLVTPKIESAKPKTINKFKSFMRIAAVLLLAAGAYLIYNISQTKTAEQMLMASTDFIISDTLSDGSVIALNKNSTLAYPETFNENTREVELKGEAFFDIEPDPEKPFIIQAGESYIQVLGTSFNVEAYADSSTIEVSVVTGVVKLYNVNLENTDTNFVILTADEIGIYNKDNNTIEKLSGYDKNSLYWQSKTLIFEKTKLSEVFNLLELTYDIKIDVSNDTINDFLLSARFKNNIIEDILTIITASFDLNFTKKNDVYLIRENKNEE